MLYVQMDVMTSFTKASPSSVATNSLPPKVGYHIIVVQNIRINLLKPHIILECEYEYFFH